ncbi:MAG: von Willebrand factor type A domain-containing protein [Gemmatimonadota bacterium]
MLGLRQLAMASGLVFAAVPATRTAIEVGSIEGNVRDEQGRALAGAIVAVDGSALKTTTARNGSYRIAGVTAGPVKVTAQLVGYQLGIEVATVPEAGVAKLDFKLKGVSLRLEELVVTDRADKSMKIRGMSAAISPIAGAPPRQSADFNTEEYRRIQENSWQASGRNPLSTFSIDVDAASYSNVRRFITEGKLPPKDAVRIEEMINYFHYDYPDPSGDDPFSVTTELSDAPWHRGHKLALIGLQGRRLSIEHLPPNNLVFLIDVSGSMYSPDKLPLVKSAFRMLVNELRPQDRVALVVYAGAAGVVLPSTPGDQKDRILDAIGKLEAGGSTAGGAGIKLAYQTARDNLLTHGNNRVILATDGDFNVGVSSDGELTRLIEDERRDGISLTVLGFGTGNLKDAKMEQLADKGNGHYAYVDNLLEAKKVFVREIGATLLTIAKDVKIQVEFNPSKVASYRLVGYENRMLAAEDFNDDAKDAGELGAGHSVTALYEIVPVGVETDVKVGSVDPLKYQGEARSRMGSDEWYTVKLRYKPPTSNTSLKLERVVRGDSKSPSADFRFASSVAEFGMVLRESEFRGQASLAAVLDRARRARGDDEEGYRAEFIRLVESVRLMKDRPAVVGER